MITESEGIILKQVKTIGGRRMLVLFTKRFGKISAGTSIDEKKKNRSALSLRPFTYGKYELNKTGDTCHLNQGEAITSHYGLGEEVGKFSAASYIMEFTDRLMPENMPCPELFLLLTDFLDAIERRSKKYEILILAYQVKALRISGNAMHLTGCVVCGKEEALDSLHTGEGGAVCAACRATFEANERLLYDAEFGIVNALRYLDENPLYKLEKLALDEKTLKILWKIMKSYLEFHLEIGGLKSEELMSEYCTL